MNLHENNVLFTDIIDAASRSTASGGLGIVAPYIEKDYWITRALQLMARAENLNKAVFKGGTSLTKCYSIGNRFSEDIDIAISDTWEMSGNQLKMLIKRTSKTMSEGLTEIVKPTTSKGSRYHKAYYVYPSASKIQSIGFINSGELLLEINSFANPYPIEKRPVRSFIHDFLKLQHAEDIIEEYELEPVTVNVLDKRRTLTEKMVSLFRASLGDKSAENLRAKIRHFYDIFHLWQDSECREYIMAGEFKTDFNTLIEHDRTQFNEPAGWQVHSILSSPLLTGFYKIWSPLSEIYEKELSSLAFAQIPTAESVAKSMEEVMEYLK